MGFDGYTNAVLCLRLAPSERQRIVAGKLSPIGPPTLVVGKREKEESRPMGR